MKKNVLNLSDQLKVANYLKNNPPKIGESLTDITKRTAGSLELVVTEPNVRAVLGAVGLKSLGTSGKNAVNKNKVIAEAIVNLYHLIGHSIPKSMIEVAESLGVNTKE